MRSHDESPIHVIIICFPTQGHINPILRLANLLATHGLHVTFLINSSTGDTMRVPNNFLNNPVPVGSAGGSIQVEFFEDGLEPGDIFKRIPFPQLMPFLERVGREALPGIIERHSNAGRPVSCLVSDPYLSWAFDVASALDIPFATIWTQSCALFSTHYHYNRNLVPFPTPNDPGSDVILPCLPVLKHDEIPTYLHPATLFPPIHATVICESKFLDNVLCIFVDAFVDLEPEIVAHLSTICRFKPVGPLCLQTSICGDLMDAANDCIGWLNGKEPSSVVYVSMGSIAFIRPELRVELAHGLIDSGLPFLWVARPNREEDESDFILPDGLDVNGKLVRWAPQQDVLAHPAVACFVTHCGWNSTMEAIAAGKPVVTFPQFGDQMTNAKFLVDVYGVGVRMSRGGLTGDVKRDEVARCLAEATVGPKAEELRRNAAKWKKKAEEAVAEGGSSESSVKEFVEMVKKKVSSRK